MSEGLFDSHWRRIVRRVLTLAIFLAGAGLLQAGLLFWGGLAIAWGSYRLYWTQLSWHSRSLLEAVAIRSAELDCNCRLEVRVDVPRVMQHEAVDTLFARLCQRGPAPASSLAEWRALLLERYVQRKRGEADAEARPELRQQLVSVLEDNVPRKTRKDGELDYLLWLEDEYSRRKPFLEEVTFIVRSGTVWKNGEVYSRDLWHDIEVVPHLLCLRLLAAEGALKVQVGGWNEGYASAPGRRDEWETVTSFPLLLCAEWHHLPERVLRLAPEQSGHRLVYRELLASTEYNSSAASRKSLKYFGGRFPAWLQEQGFEVFREGTYTKAVNSYIYLGLSDDSQFKPEQRSY